MSRVPVAFHDLTRAVSVPFFEDSRTLRIDQFDCPNSVVFDLIRLNIMLIENDNVGKCLLTGEILGDIDKSNTLFESLSGDTLTLVINKVTENGVYYFFTIDGLNNALMDQEFIDNAKHVRIAEQFPEFASVACTFSQWDLDITSTSFDWQGLSDPRKLVRDLSSTSDAMVPRDIKPWLLRPNQEIVESPIFKVWKLASTRNLCYALPSEARSVGHAKYVSFRGDKIREVEVRSLADDILIDTFAVLNSCTEWIYINQQDAEIKHTLLNYHLAFEWVGKEDWPNKELISRAWISARESYRLHLHSSGQELLRAYGEIKKALYDEVDKLSENTRGLIANFWRDFAIAAAVLVLKFLTTSNLSGEGIRIIYVATAAFLLLSLLITVAVNSKFNDLTEENRNKWYERLYPFIDEASLNELVTKPISKGLSTYSWVAYLTLIIYLIMSTYLLYLASISSP